MANPLNSLGVLKRTGFDYFNDLRPLIDLNFNSSEGLSKIKNISNIFPDSYAFADACSGMSLLQVIWFDDFKLKFLTRKVFVVTSLTKCIYKTIQFCSHTCNESSEAIKRIYFAGSLQVGCVGSGEIKIIYFFLF